jgi:hypothetical protein
MFTAFFDASGNRDNIRHSAAFYVCGFVASVERWGKLETAWPALLDKYDMPRPFRMAEFMARDQKVPNAFTGWPGDKARETAFRMDAAKVTNQCTNKPVAVGVVTADLHRMFREYDVPSSLPRPTYAWCALRAVDHVAAWAKHRVEGGKVHGKEQLGVMFEHGDPDQDVFADALLAKYRIEAVFPRNKGKQSVPFAACDWLAWECRNFMTKTERAIRALGRARSFFYGETRLTEVQNAKQLFDADKAIMREITRQHPNDALTYANWPVLQKLCEKQGWPRIA